MPPSPAPPSHLQTIDDLSGPAGKLEALLNTGQPDAPFAALVCHPYPPAGGTMHTKVVYHAMKAFLSFGLPVVRFNFRGVGLSEGLFDGGHGEQDDVRAALTWTAGHLHRPILFAGFSFGSYVGLRACCGDPRVVGRIGLGLPVRAAGRDYTYEFLQTCTGPKLLLSGDHDQFSPAADLTRAAETMPPPTRLVFVPGADHFFQGISSSPAPKLDHMRSEMRLWISETFALRRQP